MGHISCFSTNTEQRTTKLHFPVKIIPNGVSTYSLDLRANWFPTEMDDGVIDSQSQYLSSCRSILQRPAGFQLGSICWIGLEFLFLWVHKRLIQHIYDVNWISKLMISLFEDCERIKHKETVCNIDRHFCYSRINVLFYELKASLVWVVFYFSGSIASA